ncbi:hypothetical protein [Catenovulum sediminis]|uniref:Citrate synthase (unknown stereospecificity) n=1 Tax=Catenovulum sediminis TaxID=1740262 RepID=A0ABV1RG03_9ALTE|nr:hypothetical protein [Catenovulum sediminis]
MKQKNKLTEYWDSKRNKISTDIGKWIGGQEVYIRNHPLFAELFMQYSYMQIQVLNVTGKLISKELATWLENNFMCMSYPDARIWCNQIGALAGMNATSPSAAITAGVLAADSRAYGGSLTTKLAMAFIQQAVNKIAMGQPVEQLIAEAPIKHGKPAIVGYVRPVDKKDERILPHQRMTENLGFKKGPHLRLSEQLSTFLEAEYGSGINIGGYTAAFLSDQGFTPEEGYQIKALCVASGVAACFSDNVNHKKHEFLPKRCEDIRYTGPQIRSL